MYTKGYGSYHISNSYESLLTQILNRDNKINEVILANEPLNLFFDIDLKEQERKQLMDAALSRIKEIITEEFKEYEAKFCVACANSAEKESAHVIVRLYKNNQLYMFSNLDHVKTTVKKHFLNIKGLDMQVYRKEGLFRCLYQSKPNQFGRVFKISHEFSSKKCRRNRIFRRAR